MASVKKGGPTILVTGGAGYIGSHCVKLLVRRGYDVVVFDNLSGGRREAVLTRHFVHADLLDPAALERTFATYPISTVMHFAGLVQVGESLHAPDLYYRNNVVGTANLLDMMGAHSVQQLIFSSSAAVYGNPASVPIPEDAAKRPTNVYGRTKWMAEEIMSDYARAYGLRYFALRYFNAAGCDPEGDLGEYHRPETHLIPLILNVALQRAPAIQVFGTDYPTRDGTCVRDYIHVSDIAAAHVRALEALRDGHAGGAYNLGLMQGFTVQEVVDVCRAVTKREIPTASSPPRPGDPAELVANPTRFQNEFGWKPQITALEDIVASAWTRALAEADS